MPRGGDLCPNVIYLGTTPVHSSIHAHSHSGPAGINTILDGLRVCVLSGVYDVNTYVQAAEEEEGVSATYTRRQVQGLLQAAGRDTFKGVDILLTSQWPDDVLQHQEGELVRPQLSSFSRTLLTAGSAAQHGVGTPLDWSPGGC